MNIEAKDSGKLKSLSQLLKDKCGSDYDAIKNFGLTCLLLVSVLLSFFTLVSVMHQYHNAGQAAGITTKRNLQILSELNDLHSQVQQLSSLSSKPGELKTTLVRLDTELTDLEKEIANTAKSTEVQKLSVQLSDMQSDLGDLSQTFAAQFTNKKYIDAKKLPFHVLSLDVISEQPFISVDYNHHIIPLGIGDSLATWKIMSADYDTQTVELTNAQGQYVKITLSEQTA
ncbi:MAG TPA: hypothetical protein VHE99_03055 [Gammaproteobacteria bacterium]|nr:hypothetical protein [Gammaproteobacteria bacterium]